MKLLGTGSVIPSRVVTNDDFSRFLDTSDEWIYPRTGIKSRHVISSEKLEDIAAQAAERAIADAGIAKEDLDFYFALANIHLNSLMSLAASCEVSAESDNLMPEIKSLMKRFSESLHLIAYGLDDAIGQIADDNNYVGWSPIYEFEEELKESYKEHKEQFGTKTTPV